MAEQGAREDDASTQWQQTLLQILAKYGLGTLLALVFTYFILGNVSKNLEQQSEDMRAVLAVSQQTRQDMVNHIVQMDKSWKSLQLICMRLSKTEQEKVECFR